MAYLHQHSNALLSKVYRILYHTVILHSDPFQVSLVFSVHNVLPLCSIYVTFLMFPHSSVTLLEIP